MLVLWCPDWPVVAAAATEAVSVTQPAAVFSANRVVACNAVARRGGVRRGMRRREAQSNCPELAVFTADDGRDARLFEAVARAVEGLVVGVEVVRPGLVAVPVAGAAGYFGGEHALVERLVDEVSAAAGVECQVGVAEGLFAATLAARRGEFVEPGRVAEFLATLPITELDQPGADRAELVDLLRRLGLRTLGAFADLPERDVANRFGTTGIFAHRLARGRSERPPLRRRPPPELTLTEEFDPVVERVDVAAFLAKNLATRFCTGLAGHGLACTRLGIYAVTEEGEHLGRVWRCADPLTPTGVADRVRWQFEGWLRAAPGRRPTSGVVRLRLEPEETVEGRSLQLDLWQNGGSEEEDERAARAFVRVQGLLGPEGVVTPLLDGGRDPAGRVRLVPWGDPREHTTPPDATWPGRLPAPSPATVLDRPVPAQVFDADGAAVGITAREQVTAPPAHLSIAGGGRRDVVGWAGPWPAVADRRRPGPQRARLQLLLAGVRDEPPEAVLVHCAGTENPLWTVEGVYD
ncbi:DNA polymerase Y family protein [Amycolatopsis sp. OK19-0408]|uniref:DNA polymerase Y family protein n=1 Tax=Amycolatopsis iheyensis TaxID=2945988 RepID=A0A9X2NQA3_9PSEU|nr:DNA polymerase Y family protein [Amycolatopsis iheyensis]MCR6490320.1 DNA polymerase Y family protein [Amycolatopsis iheyensis]